MTKIKQQSIREAFCALGLTLFYVIAWCISAYFSPEREGVLGFPLWFELSCLYLPLVFSILVAAVIRRYFNEVEFEEEKNE